MTDKAIRDLFLQDSYQHLVHAVEKIEHCLSQLTVEQVWWRPTAEQNSIGNLVLHICGNVGQWVLSGVGGEPDSRDRPLEFSERGPLEVSQLSAKLHDCLRDVEAMLASVDEERLLEPFQVQGFETTGLGAITHSVTHFVGHMQEIISLTRTQLGPDYQFNWQPQSEVEGAS